MNNTIVQVPISKAFRDEVAVKATDFGFSSLQDLIRFFLTQFKQNLLIPTVSSPPTIKLSAKNAARYDKMVDDIESGKVKTKSFTDVDAMMKYLNS